MARNPKNVQAVPVVEEKIVSDAESGRKNDRVSQKDWLDSEGNVTNDERVASGFRFTVRATGESFEHQFGDAGDPRTMLAIFGALTKLGNELTTVKAKGEPLSIEAPKAFFDHLISTGEWGVPSAGGGARINIARLIEAVHAHSANVKARGEKSDPTRVLARLADGDIEYAKTLMNNPGVKAEYARLTVGGKQTADEELFD